MRTYRRRLAIVATGVVAVLLVAELTARALVPYLDEPLRYGDRATQAKVDQLDRLRASERCVDVVFAGNSMSRDALDPNTFSAADPAGRTAYNASLDAASPALLARWLIEEVEPRVRPATVVIALASVDLNVNAKAARSALDSYNSAVATRHDVLGRIQWAIMQHSALVDQRAALRDPSRIWDAIERARRGEKRQLSQSTGIPGVIGPRGEGLSRRALRYRPDPAGARLLREQFLDRWTLDSDALAAEAALIDDLRTRGVDVVLVVLPVTDEYLALHPNGRADHESFLAAAQTLAADTGVALIDLHDQADIDAFADTHHLNTTGSEWVSSHLPELLIRAGAPIRRCEARGN